MEENLFGRQNKMFGRRKKCLEDRKNVWKIEKNSLAEKVILKYRRKFAW